MSGDKHCYTARVVDLFCGVGGLSHGFVRKSFEVIAGYDLDLGCKFAYEENNGAIFLDKKIQDVTGTELLRHFGDADVKILIGCAPCQPFSTYSYKSEDKGKWDLLYEFARLIVETQVDVVSMENVPRLEEFNKSTVFKDFLETLERNGYYVTYKVVNCPDYGIPQHRRRLVLLASKYGEIEIIPETHSKHNYVTVEDTIRDLEPLKSGETSSTDPIHRAAKLSPLNLERIKQSKPGGTWKDWEERLKLKCHTKETGETYVSVYGRMKWDEPAPTMTTHCIGIGNGRFGHPEQDRAITLREASLLQTFPPNYKFVPEGGTFKVKAVSTQIGNAVPVKLGEVIAESIDLHLERVFGKNRLRKNEKL